MKTITIIGGGLAGLSLGIALRKKGVPVIIQEAGTYPRHRVCGEFINGVSESTLGNLGIAELLCDSRKLQTTSWHLNEKPIFEGLLDEPARGISRFELDQRLARRFEELGGQLLTRSRARRVPVDGLVWTAGRKPESQSRWIGLKVHVHNLKLRSELEMHLGSNGYVGLAPVERDRVNVCGLFERRDFRGPGISLLNDYLFANGLEALQQRLEEVEHDPESFTGVSAFQLGQQQADEELCVLGDSESIIPPFTGNGMSMAFEAAETAVPPLVEFASGARRWDDCVQTIRRHITGRFRVRLFTARILHPFLMGEPGRIVLLAGLKLGMFGPVARLLK